jgi:hypothetical protein
MLSRSVPTLGLRAAVSGTWEPIRAALNVGYRFVPSGSSVKGAVSDDELEFGGAVGVTPPGVPVVLGVEAKGAVIVGGERSEALAAGARPANLAPVELIGSARIRLPASLSLVFGGGAGLTPTLGVPTVRAFVGVDWLSAGAVPVPQALAPSDGDGDGVPDQHDQCPGSLETANGYEDDDGCPETKAVILRGDRILLLRPVRWGGTTRLADSARPVLEELATLLIDHPSLRHLRIEGHTVSDDREISRLRAVVVMTVLVRAGVEPERLEAVGFGATKRDRKGKRRDRIELHILDVAGP